MQLTYNKEQPFSTSLLHDFSLLLSLCSFVTFVAGNILLLDYSTFIAAINVEIIVLLIIFAIYFASQLSRSLLWGIVATFSILAVGAFTDNHWMLWITVTSGAFGFIVFTKNNHLNTNTTRRDNLLKAVIIGTIVILSAKMYVSFDMFDRLELGNVHRDTLYHASIASMIKNYGAISTGLHGLIETPYHVLSHSVIAAISSLSGISVLETYGFAPLLLFIPLLICAIAYVAAQFGNQNHFYKYFMLTAFVLAIASRLFKPWGINEGHFGSESYCVSLTLLILSLPLLFRKTYKHTDIFLMIIALMLMTLAKASVGAIFIGLFLARIIFITETLRQRFQELILFIVSAVMLIYLLLPTTKSYVVYSKVEYWQFAKSYSLFGDYISGPLYIAIIPILLFIALHFVFSWATIKSRVNTAGISVIFHDPVTVYSLAAIFGGLMVVILPILGASRAYYFSNVAMFVSLPWLILFIAEKKFPRIRYPYVTALLVILILKSPKLLDKTMLKRDEKPQQTHLYFIDTLVNIRDTFPNDTILKPDNNYVLGKQNPLDSCISKPLAYPAVSERAWINVINLKNNCQYEYYGYSRYLNNKGKYTALLEANIPKNTKTTTVNFLN